ncbi:hypothetical protein COCON_G00034900 [Conger conger]|uniref:Uncharacterized protein n=1 Tax=Conger conger TaxID=82655 RepID=A0A9Q1I7I9_CONCO|nr:hypothetical protein COCON_G00034900 [Conger conger]
MIHITEGTHHHTLLIQLLVLLPNQMTGRPTDRHHPSTVHLCFSFKSMVSAGFNELHRCWILDTPDPRMYKNVHIHILQAILRIVGIIWKSSLLRDGELWFQMSS